MTNGVVECGSMRVEKRKRRAIPRVQRPHNFHELLLRIDVIGYDRTLNATMYICYNIQRKHIQHTLWLDAVGVNITFQLVDTYPQHLSTPYHSDSGRDHPQWPPYDMTQRNIISYFFSTSAMLCFVYISLQTFSMAVTDALRLWLAHIMVDMPISWCQMTSRSDIP